MILRRLAHLGPLFSQTSFAVSSSPLAQCSLICTCWSLTTALALFGEAAAFWAFFRPRHFATLRSASPLPFSSDFLTSLQDEGSDQHYFQNEAVREVLVEKRGEKKDG